MFDFLTNKFSSIFQKITGNDRLTEKNINEILQKMHDSLLEADVPYQVIDAFVAEIKKEALGQKVLASLKPQEQFIKVAHDALTRFLGGASTDKDFLFAIPSIIMVMGLQGSGKTTTVAKLAALIQKQAQQQKKKCSILVASVDFYRPAAIDQLDILARQVGVQSYRSTLQDPVQAAQDIFTYYTQHKFDILLLDTAGRLHVDEALLGELQKIDAIIKPTYKLLVLDAMTGQESLQVAKSFNTQVGFNAAILTKLDSETRGGAAFAFKYELKLPIEFLGTGEKMDDLEPFRPERMADRILGMGDLLSLVEKAQEKIQKAEQERMERSFKTGNLTLEDFLLHLNMMNRMGSLTSLAKYIPGMNMSKVSPDALQQGELELKRFKAIIQSMTPKERRDAKLLNGSRKQRIAQGSGVQVAAINTLLSRFEELQQFVKLFKKFR